VGTPQRRKKWAEYDDALTDEKETTQEYHSADEYEVEENKGLPFDIDARQAPLLQEESSDEGQTDEKDHAYPRSKTVNDFFKNVLKLKSNQSVHKFLVEDDETREELDTLNHQQRDEAEEMLEGINDNIWKACAKEEKHLGELTRRLAKSVHLLLLRGSRRNISSKKETNEERDMKRKSAAGSIWQHATRKSLTRRKLKPGNWKRKCDT
jgi:hypothetical protein